MEILAFPWMGSREREINDPYKGTCQWLPKHPKFDQWTRQDRGMLWLRGAPGCGKSTLTKYVRHISSRPFGPDALALSFFFNSAGDDLETSSAGLYRTLLYQVLQTHPDAAPNLCHHTRSFGNREDMVTGDFTRMLALEFKASIARILQEKPVVILIDALDECREAAAPLVRYFRGLLRETLPPVHPLGVLISSRLDPPLGSGLGDSTIAISPGDTVDDIMAYFIGALRSQPYFHPVDRSFILESFRGCFRAASLLVHREKMDSERRWPPTVSPSYVYSEYVGIMKGAPSGDDTRKLAEWLCCATAPLSVRQLQLAMSLDPVAIWGSLQEVRDLNDSMTSQAMDDKLSALGCGLVDIIPSDNRRIVHFIDAEFKDYLASGGLAKLSDHAPSQTREDAVAQVHSRLGRICFKYFRMTVQAITGPVEQPLGEQHVARFPLVEYATLSWPTHMSLGQDAEPAHDQLVDWLDEPLVKVWISRYNQLVSRNGHGEQIPMGTSILHLLAMFGLYYMTHRVLDRPGGNTLAQVNIQDAQGRTPLFSAAAAGHGRVVEMLLDYGAEVDWKDEQGQSPLFEAARKGRTETVRILLDRGADVNLRDSDYESPLLVAAENGHGAIVQLLLEREATTDSDGVSFPRPLAAAVEKNHEHVVDILIAYGADLNSKYAPALVIAAMWGREAVARLLIEHGADVDSKGFRGDSPLGIAAAYGHGTVASLLIDNGAQLNAEDTDRTPPIIQAAQNGHRGIVSLLIACGADLQVEDYPGGRTLLAIAATDGDLVNARLLIEHGADVLATDDGGVSALSRAVKHGHEEIVRLLLDSGADTNSEDDESRSALAYAAANNDEAVMRQLLERGAGMGSEDARLLGHSPLAMAVRANHETAVRLLLGHGADPNEGINELPSMLSMAAHGGHLEVAKLLISHEADVDEGGPYGRQPLVAAASSGHDDMIKLLINHGAQLQPAKPSSSHARSALMKAAAKGHVSTVKLLLDKGAHVNWWDADDGTALSQAVQNQQLDVVRTLLDGGADPDPPTSRSYSPLAIAARLGLMDIVQLLLDHGDDPRKKDMYGRTPIDIATSHGHEEVARLMAQRKPKGMPLSRSRRRDSYG